MKVYLAGPMRGFDLFNFPAFDAAAERLRAQGHDVVSPADLDRAIGFDPSRDTPDAAFLRRALARDLAAITECDAVAVLPGWQGSQGARLEVQLARVLGLPVLDADTMRPWRESALAEAHRITHGDRNKDYGHPLDDYIRTAALWSAFLGVPIDYRQAMTCMILVKVSRLAQSPEHRDSLVDIAGYADCLDRSIVESRDRMNRLAEKQ